MSILNEITKREVYGGVRPSWSLKGSLPDFIHETFQCYRKDKHLLLNQDCTDCPGYQCRFCSVDGYGHLAMIAKEDGFVEILNVEKNADAIIDKYKGHNNCIFDVQWLTHLRFLTSSGDSSIRMHDLEKRQILQKFNGHAGSVKCLAKHPNNVNLFSSSSRDNSILLWDARKKSNNGVVSSVQSIYLAHSKDSMEAISKNVSNKRKSKIMNDNGLKSVTGLIYMNENTLLSSGSSDGLIKMWDIRKLGVSSHSSVVSKSSVSPVRYIEYDKNELGSRNPPGFTDIVCNRSGSILFAGSRDGHIYQYDLTRSNIAELNEPVLRYSGHSVKSFYLKMDLNPIDESFLVSGSSSNSPYVYKVGKCPQKPLLLNGHVGEVTVARWSYGIPGCLVTVSDDCSVMVHRIQLDTSTNKTNFSTSEEINQLGNKFKELASISSRSGQFTVNWSNQKRPPITLNTIQSQSSQPIPSKSSNNALLTTTPINLTKKQLYTPPLFKFFSPRPLISPSLPLSADTVDNKSASPYIINNSPISQSTGNRPERAHSFVQNKRILTDVNNNNIHSPLVFQNPVESLQRTASKRLKPSNNANRSTQNNSNTTKSGLKRRKTAMTSSEISKYPSITKFMIVNDNKTDGSNKEN